MRDPPTVLIADDEDAVRQAVTDLLSRVGYSVCEAHDGTEALEKLANDGIDALLLDVKMPGKDGIAVLEAIEPRPPPPGVLLISAYDIDGQVIAQLGNKVHMFLRKPVPPSTLIEAVAGAVKVARSSRSS